MHNLFGDTDSVNIYQRPDGSVVHTGIETHDTIEDMLRYVHLSPEELMTYYRDKVAGAKLSAAERAQYLDALRLGPDPLVLPGDLRRWERGFTGGARPLLPPGPGNKSPAIAGLFHEATCYSAGVATPRAIGLARSGRQTSRRSSSRRITQMVRLADGRADVRRLAGQQRVAPVEERSGSARSATG